MDGEWVVKNKELMFLNGKAKSALATNNLIIKSQRLEFIYNFNLQHSVGAKTESINSLKGSEMLAFSISPEIYDIKTFSPQTTLMHSHGLIVYFLRNEFNRVGLFLRKFPMSTTIDIRESITASKNAEPGTWCAYEYLNKTTNLNFC